MGAWGHEALDSDYGLDVVEFIESYIGSKYPNTEQVDLTLSELIDSMEEDSFFENGGYFYDNSVMALVELFLIFKKKGVLPYENEEDETMNLEKRVRTFSGDHKSFDFLLQCLTDMKNEVPDKNGKREIVENWKDSDYYDEWKENLEELIIGLKTEIGK